MIPRYAEDPFKFVGDLTNTFAPNSPLNSILPNTYEDRYNRRKYLYNPLLNNKEKRIMSDNEAFSMVPNILRNIALAEFGYVFNGYLPQSFKEIASIGSSANLSGNVYEIYNDIKNNNIDKFINDNNFGLNFLLNVGSLFTRFDNFDASTINYNLKN